jgi:hypothetical protein
MENRPTIPPRHRHYPRSRPVAVRHGAGTSDGHAAPRPGAGWKRTVPEHRAFPRGR